MLKKIEKFCQEYNMLPEGGSVLACVSGGTDSMCLLHVLRALAPKYDLRLYAAHYNHNLRGAESDGDEAFVREQCEKLGVPLITGSGDVAAEAARLGRGIEETARDMRYAFFFRTAGLEKIDRVATAHNCDDNLETVLLRLARGTGLRGLCGIPPVRGKLIRPLLNVTRAEIEVFNLENSVPHREDSTNLSDDYARNRVRHSVAPVLKELNPALNITPMTELLRADADYLDSLARSFLDGADGSLDVEKLLSLPRPVAARAVRLFCNAELSRAHVEQVLRLAGSPDPSAELSLPNVKLRREYGKIVRVTEGAPAFEEIFLTLDSPVIISGTDFTVFCKECVFERGIYNSLTTFYVKRDKIVGALRARPRRTGDSLRLRGGTRSLKKLMIDKKIPRALRDKIPVIADGRGPVAVWSVGQDISYLPAPGEPAIEIKIEEIRQ